MVRNNILVRILVIILLFFVFPVTVKANSVPEKKQIIVVFRFDDYSSRSTTDIEVDLINAFQKHNIPCTFGVIPYRCAGNWHDVIPQDVVPLTPVKVEILKKAVKGGILEVAQHGYSHQTICRGGLQHKFAEMSGLDYNSQVERIGKGKDYLERMLGTRIDTFIPPWDRYDYNTLLALEKLGFKTISADMYGVASKSSSLKFLPETCSLLRLRHAIESARHIPEIQPVIVVLFHEFDIFENNKKEAGLSKYFLELLDWVVSQKDIRVMTIKQATAVIDDLSARRFMDASYYAKLYKLIPPSLLGKLYPVGVYLSSSANTTYGINIKIKLWVLILFFYFTILVISIAIAFFSGAIIFSRLKFMIPVCKYGGLTFLVLLLIYVFSDAKISYRGATAIVVLLGAYIGAWNSFQKLNK